MVLISTVREISEETRYDKRNKKTFLRNAEVLDRGSSKVQWILCYIGALQIVRPGKSFICGSGLGNHAQYFRSLGMSMD